jgi:hypothetical protein
MSMRLALFVAVAAVANAEIMLMYTNTPPSDPAGSHCEDVKADMSTADAKEWWSANAYAYPASQGWTKGSLCDPKVYPKLEHENHPIGVDDVTLRRLGKAPPALIQAEPQKISKFEIGDNHCTNLVIDMSKNSTECLTYQWWADNKWHYDGWTDGTCSKPYTKMTRDEHPIAVPCIDIFSYGVGAQVEPLVEVSEEWTNVMIMHNIAPGGSHCTELYWQGGKNNPYWKEHGYQYPQPLWQPSTCDRKTFNWFNRNGTIAEGVTAETWGKHI